MGFKRIYFYILLVAVSVGYFYLVFTNYNENKHQTYDSAVLSQIKTVQKYKAIINERIEQQKRLLEETAKFVATKDYTQDYTTIKGVLSIVARTGSF
jgi:putative two component sensor kinase